MRLLGILLTFTLSSPLWAGIYGKDNRIQAPGKYPFTAMGKVKTAYENCTGFMVSRCHAITVGHCGSLLLTPPLSFITDQGTEALVAHPAFEPRFEDYFYIHLDKDFQFLHLNKNIGDETGWLKLEDVTNEHLASRKNRVYSAAGYNGDLSKDYITVDETATPHFSDPTPDLVRLRADSFRGISGGPLFYYNSKSEPLVVGIVTNAFLYRDRSSGVISQLHFPDQETEHLSLALPTHFFFEELREFQAQYPCSN